MSGRSFYLTRSDWPGEPGDEGEVVDTLHHAPEFLEQAVELWALAGHPDRAERIHAATEPGYARKSTTLHTPEIKILLDVIDLGGMKQSLVQSGVVDEQMMIHPDRLAEVRQRVRLVDVGEHRGSSARYGIAEAVPRVYQLCAFLQRALDEGLHVALD